MYKNRSINASGGALLKCPPVVENNTTALASSEFGAKRLVDFRLSVYSHAVSLYIIMHNIITEKRVVKNQMNKKSYDYVVGKHTITIHFDSEFTNIDGKYDIGRSSYMVLYQ